MLLSLRERNRGFNSPAQKLMPVSLRRLVAQNVLVGPEHGNDRPMSHDERAVKIVASHREYDIGEIARL